MTPWMRFVVVLIGFYYSAAASRLSAEPTSLPEPLKEWVGWIKERHPEWECARGKGDFLCLWPSRLEFRVEGDRLSFEATASLLQPALLPLPSSGELSLKTIQVREKNGRAIEAVLHREGSDLLLKLPKGIFEISGAFSSGSIPEVLPAPSAYGIVNISGRLGVLERLPLGVRMRQGETSDSADSLNIRVIRHVKDGAPLVVETRLALEVSGAARSIKMGMVLPSGSTPISIVSPLPHQLTAAGVLSLQLTPGVHVVTITSLLPQPLFTLTLPRPEFAQWPSEEIIVWEGKQEFRSVAVSGGVQVSGELAHLPSEWSSGAAFALPAGGSLSVTELAAGREGQYPPSKLRLVREMWLDLSGEGLSVKDYLEGALYGVERINAIARLQLGRAATRTGEPLFVSKDPETGAPGIKLQGVNLDLYAISRIEDSRTIPASGWSERLSQGVATTLWLPPSWRLLKVDGGSAPGSWWESWTLLDVFVTILIVLGYRRLLGTVVASVVCASLILNHAEFLAPRMLLIHFLLLIVAQRLVGESPAKWQKLCALLLLLTYGAWAFQSLAFIKLQVVQLLYPQLEAGTRYRTVLQELIALTESNLLCWPSLLVAVAFITLATRSLIRSVGWRQAVKRIIGWTISGVGVFVILTIGIAFIGFGSRINPSGSYSERWSQGEFSSSPMTEGTSEADVANRTITSGPALPTWRWRSYQISVPGPVASDQTIGIRLVSPTVMRLVSLLRIVLLSGLVVILFRRMRIGLRSSRLAPFAIIALLFFHSLIPLTAIAETPSPELLQELEQRLGSSLCRREVCTTITDARITIDEGHFELELDATSDGRAAVSVPGPVSVLAPESIVVNGSSSTAVRRSSDDFLQVLLEHGQNKVVVHGSISAREAWSLQFEQSPLHAAVVAPNWLVEGLAESGVAPPSSLRFSPLSKEGSEVQVGSTDLPIWIKISRRIEISDRVTLQSKIFRFGETAREASATLALLPGERVTSSNIMSDGDIIRPTFPPGVSTLEFSSTLPWAERIILTAQQTPRVNEEWSVTCGVTVQCDYGGNDYDESKEGVQKSKSEAVVVSRLRFNGREATWSPLPGERAEIAITPLSGIAGEVLTIDSLTHSLTPAPTEREGYVQINLRTTTQEEFSLTLPDATSLQGVTLDDSSGGISASGNPLRFLLSPGRHVIALKYREARARPVLEKMPTLQLSIPASNISSIIHPGSDQWLIWVGGGSWGPAVVFWSKLLCLVILCALFALFKLLPLGLAGATLLGIGLTTLSLVLVVVPLAWLILLRLTEDTLHLQHFVSSLAAKIGLAVLTIGSLVLFWHIVRIGLVLSPPMLVAGNLSTATELRWFADRSSGTLPTPWILSLPLWTWRAFALGWATWLAVALLSWLQLVIKRCRGEG